MGDAVNSTEKIRGWTEHLIDPEELSSQLNTVIKKSPEDVTYYGLSDS